MLKRWKLVLLRFCSYLSNCPFALFAWRENVNFYSDLHRLIITCKKNYRSWNHASRSGNDLYDNDILHISSPISSLSLSLFTNYARVCQIFWKLYVTEKVFFVCLLFDCHEKTNWHSLYAKDQFLFPFLSNFHVVVWE